MPAVSKPQSVPAMTRRGGGGTLSEESVNSETARGALCALDAVEQSAFVVEPGERS